MKVLVLPYCASCGVQAKGKFSCDDSASGAGITELLLKLGWNTSWKFEELFMICDSCLAAESMGTLPKEPKAQIWIGGTDEDTGKPALHEVR